jgi:phosphoglycolate phosphatase
MDGTAVEVCAMLWGSILNQSNEHAGKDPPMLRSTSDADSTIVAPQLPAHGETTSLSGTRDLPGLLIFDLNGVLFETHDVAGAVINEHRRANGMRDLSIEEVRAGYGHGVRAFVRSRMAEPTTSPADAASMDVRRVSATLIDEIVDAIRVGIVRQPRTYPGAAAVLAGLSTRARIAVVSNMETDIAEELVETGGLRSLLTTVIGSASKPDPSVLLKLCRSIQVPPASAVMIGDDSPDFRCAHVAGMTAIGCAYGYGRRPIAPEPIRWITTLAELPGVLEAIWGGLGDLAATRATNAALPESLTGTPVRRGRCPPSRWDRPIGVHIEK